MRWYKNFLIFLAVLGTAIMFSPVASEMPGGKWVGWGVAGFAWIAAFLFMAFYSAPKDK